MSRQIEGRITVSSSPGSYGPDVTYDEADEATERVVAAANEYMDRNYPGSDVNIVVTIDCGYVTSADFICDAETGEDLPDVMLAISDAMNAAI